MGQAGFEHVYNKVLMGQDGARRVVVNSLGREIRTLEEVPPSEGRRVQLTIDYDVQRAAEEAFKALGFAGAAVVLEPNTGEVLAYVSLPAYDPNTFAGGIDRATWTALNSDAAQAAAGPRHPGPLFARVHVQDGGSGRGARGGHHHARLLASPATGGADFYGRCFKCWKKEGHGTVDLRRAIERSCDTYFYTLGKMVGVDKINKWATRLGLGVKSGIDLPNEVTGLVPSSEWKRLRFKEPWYPGETISVAIGQGQVTVTPVSMAVYMAALANGGRRVTPHLMRAVDDGSGWKSAVRRPRGRATSGMKPETINAIHDGMWMVVNAGGHRRQRAHARLRRVGQDRHRAGDLARGRSRR